MNYAFGLTQLAGSTLKNAVRNSSDLQGWPSTGQRGPTCGYNGPAKAFQYLLRRFGFSKSDIKEVTHSARLFWCIRFAEQLAAIRCHAGQTDASLAVAAVPNAGYGGELWTGAGMDPAPPELIRVVSKTVWEMIDICCHNLSGSALKLHDRGRLTDDGLRLSLAVCRRVRQLLPKASLYRFKLPKPLPPFRSDLQVVHENSTTNQPLELLLDWPKLDIESKAGPINSDQFPNVLPIASVLEDLANGKTLQELLPALKKVVNICKGIRERFESKGEVAVSKLHVLGLLHSCFAANIGAVVPLPFESRGEEGKSGNVNGKKSSPWTSGPITAQFQEEAITYILELACELSAASKSLPQTRGTTALDTIAMGYLVVCMDAVIVAQVNEFGKDATKKEKKSGHPRILLWQNDYKNLGLSVQQMGATSDTGCSFADCTADAPVSWPGAIIVRANIQAYLDSAKERGLGGEVKSYFLDWPKWESNPQDKETVFYLKNNMKQLDHSCSIFRKLAIAMGYHPAQNQKQWNPKYHNENTGVTKNGKAIRPIGKDVRDWPDFLILHDIIYKECKAKEVTFDGTPDKACKKISEHMFAIGWAFGNEMNSKLFAQNEGRFLCRVRDIILLAKIMLEPRNTNGSRPVTGLKVGKICSWSPDHARPNVMVYGAEFNSSDIYLGTRIGLTAFNRTWQLGRERPKADCSLDSPLLNIKWDADAMLKSTKEEDDVLHASKIPTFNGSLSSEDSEALISFLAVPGLRASLVLNFFAEKSRLTSLFNESLQKILWASTFCPDSWPKPASVDNITGEATPPAPIKQVPSNKPSRLHCRLGLLFVELRSSPEVILKACVDMVENAAEVASISDFTTPYASTFFFVVRLAVGVLNYARTIPETFVSNQHWQNDGFKSAPAKETMIMLQHGVKKLSSTLLKLAIPLCQKWIDQAMVASIGMEEDVDTRIEQSSGITEENRAARLIANLQRQELAQEMAITANAHMVLLSSPSLCGESSIDYSTDDLGTQIIASSIKSMAYIVEWHGKGMGLKFYGDSVIPPTEPPGWRGNKAHMVCGGFRRAWPELDIDISPLLLSDFDPGVLGVAPQELWSTLAKRRKAISVWFKQCHKKKDTSRAVFVLSGIIASGLGDPYAQWPIEDNMWEQNTESRLQSSVFTHPNGRMRVDILFAELNFSSGREGIMTMPDVLGSNTDLQHLLASARGGVESSILPHVVARQIRRYMQTYYLPAVVSGDEGLELQYWQGIPLKDDSNGEYITVSGFPTGLNGKYFAIKQKSCLEPVYKKAGGRHFILRRTRANGDKNPKASGDRYHIEYTMGGPALAFTTGQLSIGVPDTKNVWNVMRGGEWKPCPECKAVLHQTIINLNFGQASKTPKKLSWNGILAVHNGSMDRLSEKDGWIVFDVYHEQGGYYDMYLTYTAHDSRPCKLRVNGIEISSNVAAKTTGGWGADTIKAMSEPECRVDLGPAKTIAKVEFRAVEYMPHLSKMIFDPVDGRRDVEGMPIPQSYTGNLTKSDRGSVLDDGVMFESNEVFDLTIVTFRNRQYGGANKTCRMSIFNTEGLESLCTSQESNILATNECVGGRYNFYTEQTEAAPLTSKKWRIAAPQGTGSKQWHVEHLQFLDKQGQPIDQRNAHAICCGSTIASLGPENALNCRPEIVRIDSGGKYQEVFALSTTSTPPTNVHSGNAWVGTLDTDSANGERSGKIKESGATMYIGLEFEYEVEIHGFKIIQGKNNTKYLSPNLNVNSKSLKTTKRDYAERVSLQCLDQRSGDPGIWKNHQTFTMRESALGKEATRILGQSAGGKYRNDGNGNSVAFPTYKDCLLGVMASDSDEKWIVELLLRCIKGEATKSLIGDNVIMLFPQKHGQNSSTILLCDPSKPSPNRWSIMSLDRCHHVVNIFGLREHGRRCMTEHIWTSNYTLSKHEILPETSFRFTNESWQPHPWCKNVAGSLFDDNPATGGWTRGTSMRPSLVVVRKFNGNNETLIPSRYLTGVLPDCLTNNFRFWKDENLHTVMAEKTLDADETWFGYDLEIRVRASSIDKNTNSKKIKRQKSSLRISNSNMTTLNIRINKLQKKVKQLQDGKGSLEEKLDAMKLLSKLRRKRQEVQRNVEKDANDGAKTLVAARMQQSGIPEVSIYFDIVRSRPDPSDLSTLVRHRLVDFTSTDVRPGTWLSDLCNLFLRIENAAHILLWAAVDHPEDKPSGLVALHEVVEIIELPRLRLRFTTSYNSEGKLRVMSSEYDGKFILAENEMGTKEEQGDLRNVAAISPFTLLLGVENVPPSKKFHRLTYNQLFVLLQQIYDLKFVKMPREMPHPKKAFRKITCFREFCRHIHALRMYLAIVRHYVMEKFDFANNYSI